VSVLLLIVVAALAGTVTYLWVTGVLGRLARGGKERGILRACLKVSGVEVAARLPDGTAFMIWLVNCGESTLHLDHVYLCSPSGIVYHEYDPGDWPLPPGSPTTCGYGSQPTA